LFRLAVVCGLGDFTVRFGLSGQALPALGPSSVYYFLLVQTAGPMGCQITVRSLYIFVRLLNKGADVSHSQTPATLS